MKRTKGEAAIAAAATRATRSEARVRLSCARCDHVFDGFARYAYRGREKVLFLDVPVGGGFRAAPPYVCQWCNVR